MKERRVKFGEDTKSAAAEEQGAVAQGSNVSNDNSSRSDRVVEVSDDEQVFEDWALLFYARSALKLLSLFCCCLRLYKRPNQNLFFFFIISPFRTVFFLSFASWMCLTQVCCRWCVGCEADVKQRPRPTERCNQSRCSHDFRVCRWWCHD